MYFKNISIKNLLVSSDNYRFDPQEDETNAIEMMLYMLGEKQVNLAKDILDHGLAPNETIIVIEEETRPGKFRVLEGNRRVSAIKMLQKPDRIRDEDLLLKYEQKFRRLGKNGLRNDITILKCCVVDTIDEADHWIQKKHITDQKGKGVESWSVESAERYSIVKGEKGPTIGYLIMNELRKRKVFRPPHEFGLTTFNRIMQTAYAQEMIGVTKDDKNKLLYTLPEEQVIDRLRLLISRFPNKRGEAGITSRSTNTTEDIKKAVDSLYENNSAQPSSEDLVKTYPDKDLSTDNPEGSKFVDGSGGDSSNDTSMKGNEEVVDDIQGGGQKDGGHDDIEDPNEANPGSGTNPPNGNGKRKSPPRATEFFEDFDTSLLEPIKQTALFYVLNELIMLSKSVCTPYRKQISVTCYESFPNATASLLRTVLELSLKHIIKKRNLMNELEQSVNRGNTTTRTFIMLNDIKKFITKKSPDIFFTEPSAKTAYELLVDGIYVDVLNGLVHHPGTTRANPDLLKGIAQSGLITLIVYILKQ